MSSSLESISPLIPVPARNGTPLPPPPNKADLDDLFATLFSPATPPASPTPFGSSSIFEHPSNTRPRVGSISTASSTDSDFGLFVSVPASEDPLAQPPLREPSPSKPSAAHPSGPSADFFAEARAATARNQQGLLAELLQHEDDPMYWHEHAPSPSPSPSPSPFASESASPSGIRTPQPPQSQPQPTGASAASIFGAVVAVDEPVKLVMENAIVNPLLDALSEATSDSPFAPPRSVSVTPRRPPPSPVTRSPSLPPSPSRPSPPILTRVQSTSTFSSTTPPSRWMASFLTYRGPPPSSSPPARLAPTRASITHGSPFAASPFVPTSGAPGFDGDRAWNKGFDDSDGSGPSERHGVQLLGRKESTRVVLGNSLANTVRPVTSPAQTALLLFY